MMRDRIVRAAAGLFVGLGLLLTASPAAAHTELTATSPASGATVDVPVEEITLTYSGAVRADGSTVEVTGADGTTYGDGPLAVIDTVVHQPVRTLPSGTYTVRHRIIAADGHAMEGSFTFTVALPPELEPTTPAAGAPEPTQAPDPSRPAGAGADVDDPRSTAGIWLGAASLTVALIALIYLVRRYSRRRRG